MSLIHLETDGKIKLSICMYCRLMEVMFEACFTITYIADILTKQINTVGNTAQGRCDKGDYLNVSIITKCIV